MADGSFPLLTSRHYPSARNFSLVAKHFWSNSAMSFSTLAVQFRRMTRMTPHALSSHWIAQRHLAQNRLFLSSMRLGPNSENEFPQAKISIIGSAWKLAVGAFRRLPKKFPSHRPSSPSNRGRSVRSSNIREKKCSILRDSKRFPPVGLSAVSHKQNLAPTRQDALLNTSAKLGLSNPETFMRSYQPDTFCNKSKVSNKKIFERSQRARLI